VARLVHMLTPYLHKAVHNHTSKVVEKHYYVLAFDDTCIDRAFEVYDAVFFDCQLRLPWDGRPCPASDVACREHAVLGVKIPHQHTLPALDAQWEDIVAPLMAGWATVVQAPCNAACATPGERDKKRRLLMYLLVLTAQGHRDIAQPFSQGHMVDTPLLSTAADLLCGDGFRRLLRSLPAATAYGNRHADGTALQPGRVIVAHSRASKAAQAVVTASESLHASTCTAAIRAGARSTLEAARAVVAEIRVAGSTIVASRGYLAASQFPRASVVRDVSSWIDCVLTAVDAKAMLPDTVRLELTDACLFVATYALSFNCGSRGAYGELAALRVGVVGSAADIVLHATPTGIQAVHVSV
jgi:hypothetical protein